MKTAWPFCFPWWVFILVFEQVLIIHSLCFPQILSISVSKDQVRAYSSFAWMPVHGYLSQESEMTWSDLCWEWSSWRAQVKLHHAQGRGRKHTWVMWLSQAEPWWKKRALTEGGRQTGLWKVQEDNSSGILVSELKLDLENWTGLLAGTSQFPATSNFGCDVKIWIVSESW